MAVLEELEQAIRTVAAGAGRSVVGVGARWGRGSGVVVGDGRVLTNAHNVRGPDVAVSFEDGRAADGTVAGVDEDADLAVISVDTGDAPALEWAEEGAAGLGSPGYDADGQGRSGAAQ